MPGLHAAPLIKLPELDHPLQLFPGVFVSAKIQSRPRPGGVSSTWPRQSSVPESLSNCQGTLVQNNQTVLKSFKFGVYLFWTHVMCLMNHRGLLDEGTFHFIAWLSINQMTFRTIWYNCTVTVVWMSLWPPVYYYEVSISSSLTFKKEECKSYESKQVKPNTTWH